jgi:phage shock protein E
MRLVISFFAVAVLALGILTACNSNELKNARSSSATPAAGPPLAAPPNTDGVRRVTVTELKDMLAKNEALVVDVRNEASFAMGHIKGSKLIPEAEVANRMDELPKNKLVVTYCS